MNPMSMPRHISASSFRCLLLCPHSLFLDHHGNPSLKTELGEFENYLLDDGKRFETEDLQGQTYVQPDYPEGDLDAGAQATLNLMAAGHALIYQGVLLTDRFVGIPDLLVKRQGQSALGGWYYEPREIKTAKSVKETHVLQLCMYAMMLEEVQGQRPQTATIILADESEDMICSIFTLR
jgi:predicted RecB family nuclease